MSSNKSIGARPALRAPSKVLDWLRKSFRKANEAPLLRVLLFSLALSSYVALYFRAMRLYGLLQARTATTAASTSATRP